MNRFLFNLFDFLLRTADYTIPFFGALALSLALTPVCREAARRLGMVDKPSARRINKTPIPRAGGLAVFISTALCSCLAFFVFDVPCTIPTPVLLRLIALGGALCIVGLLDDRFGLPPLVKLAGQLACAAGAWLFCGVSVATYLPFLPAWLDCPVTIFWIVGAVNAFNLIDGLDGLASGLAAIATFGMIGALLCIGRPAYAIVYLIFLGSCLGFLRYNFHPASVFLGDTGSMFIGFFLSTTPLLIGSSNSMLVGIGVPLLAMGVPIFDTALAIVRRTIRAVLSRNLPESSNVGNSELMSADTDHLHHRILRKFLSQRKAALALYAFAALLVFIGVGGILLRGRAVSLYILGFIITAVIIFRDMRRIELWDAGRLLNALAHDHTTSSRRRIHVFSTPMFLLLDWTILILAWLVSCFLLSLEVTSDIVRRWLVLRSVPMFIAFVLFRTYSTVWSRAILSNFVRLIAAVASGTAATVVITVLFDFPHTHLAVFSVLYASIVACGVCAIRNIRPALRDLFYALSTNRLLHAKNASRIAVYGAGLRYRMFRRELVRSADSNTRVIVALIDDDILLRNHFIGGIKVAGTLDQARSIIEKYRIESVVITCKLSPHRLALAKEFLASLGVKTSIWYCEEKEL